MIQANDLAALARSRQEEALAWAERRRLLRLVAGAGGGDQASRPAGALERRDAADLRRSIEHLGRLARGFALVALLLGAATAVSAVATDPGAGAGAAVLSLR